MNAASLIGLLCVGCLTGATALAHKRTQKIQTKLNASAATAAHQPWSPQVHAYIRYLEALEEGDDVLVEKASVESKDEAIPQKPAGNGTVMFVVLSDSNHYGEQLRWISETWGQDLPASQLMAIGDASDRSAHAGMQVQPTRCPAHTHDGACCKEAEAVINAQSELKKNPHLKWAYIVDDDTFVRPAALEERLKGLDTRGAQNHGALVAIPGCSTKKCARGFCGGGGGALSREALTTLVGDSPATYLKQHMQTCDRCEMWGDMTLGTQADEHGISIWNPQGLNGWLLDKASFDKTLSAASEPLMYHYMRSEAQLFFLHRLFSPSDTFQGPEQQGIKDECATFKGNTQCWSDPHPPPWSPKAPLLGL